MLEQNYITLKVFAELKDIFGKNELQINLKSNIIKINVTDFLLELTHDYPEFNKIYSNIQNRYKIYLNGALIEKFNDTVIKSTDELAILPPVGGG